VLSFGDLKGGIKGGPSEDDEEVCEKQNKHPLPPSHRQNLLNQPT
jgi:hypothetical protein